MVQKQGLKWTPATPIRKADNIVSSDARLLGEKGFIPSYEHKKFVAMNFLLSNEYMRIWFKERAAYEKEVYGSREVQAQSSVQRRYVVRRMHKIKEEPKTFIKKTKKKPKKEAEKKA